VRFICPGDLLNDGLRRGETRAGKETLSEPESDPEPEGPARASRSPLEELSEFCAVAVLRRRGVEWPCEGELES
jgi:hypothetical protein